jgi:eukaryotic-like serine/threonine-protein kinase
LVSAHVREGDACQRAFGQPASVRVAFSNVVEEEAGVPNPSAIGRALDGRYRLEAEIGVGGLGAVYRATHEKLDKSVAIKLLHQHCGTSELLRGRFEREAKALATLDHPNIVSVTDFGIAEDTPYLVMELLEGETLAERLDRGPLAGTEAPKLIKELLAALRFVHERGLVHRDMKPSNVFLQRLPSGGERVKILDFGLAKFMGPDPAPEKSEPTLTRAGAVVGTPAYMSPEQAAGDSADARSDV